MKRLKFFVLLIFLMNFSQEILTETTLKSVENPWPRRVLITNDNGINDIKIIELARAFSKVAETCSIPRVPLTEIMGIKVVPRAMLQISALPTFALAKKAKESLKRQLWMLQPPLPSRKITEAEGDIAAYRKNFIVIVPMNVCEVDYDYLPELQKHMADFPSWQASPARSGKKKISSTK